jgi:Polyketide cyclase / dehydrase and lipid transport
MKVMKKALLVVLLIPIVLVVVSLFLPASYRVERRVTMNARPSAVFPHINSPRHWPEWTAWTVAKYPDMRVSFTGPEAGMGASYSWEGKSSGRGTLKITRSEPDESIGYDLDFEKGKHVSKGAITLEPSGESVAVTWSNEGDLGWNPVSRFFGLFMDKMMGPDLEEGLRNLQKKVEAR